MQNTNENQKPNILLILTDQMRSDCLSFLGHKTVQTPNLDQLCNEGTAFTAAYSPCPSCIAARASIFTGLTPSSHGRLGYQDKVPWTYKETLPQVLSEAGYQTHCVGKTHFYPQRNHCGFQSLNSYECRQNFDGLYINDYDEWLREKSNGMLHERDHGLNSNSWVTRPSHLPEEYHNNTWVVTKGVDFLKRRDKTRPFFLNLSFHRPHPPIDPPQAFFDMYRDADLDPVPVGKWAEVHNRKIATVDDWEGKLDEKLLNQARRGYYAQIAHIDAQIGRFLRAMQELKAGPTVILFTTDHGEMLGDHNLFRKTYAYEGSAGVPFIVTLPNKNDLHTSDIPVTLEDVYPTLLEAAGVTCPDTIEGESLLGIVKGQKQKLARDHVHGEHSACYSDEEAMQFLTDGKEKYIWFTRSGKEQFFDLTKDPQELEDLSGNSNYAERVELWRRRLIDRLSKRPQDGLSNGKQLIPGKLLPAVRF